MKNYKTNALTITIEPVKHCNINCSYCYCNNNIGTRMETAEINYILQSIFEYMQQTHYQEVHFIWHGGEPLLAGFAFYKEAFEKITTLFLDKTVCHFMQTNGLLIDQAFISLFESYQVDVGISLDGPKDLHDQLRVDFNNQGTHDQVLNIVNKLKNSQVILGFNMVITRPCINQETRIYNFFRDLGYGFRINPILVSPNRESTKEYALPHLGYGKIMCGLFDAWTHTETSRVPISPISSYLKAMLTGRTTECQHSADCVGENFGIKPGGQVFLCTRFEEYAIGNFKHNTLIEITNSYRAQQVAKRQYTIDVCQSCKYQPICRGGCPHNAYTAFDTVDVRDPYCNDYQKIFAHMKKALRPFDQDEKIIAIGR
jgi:uncharacterized protein